MIFGRTAYSFHDFQYLQQVPPLGETIFLTECCQFLH
uniref:Uncharacterized protein n=1 Tax=Arundo donax TaxID=35708 RepID=A0A0A9HKR8_ARUDO